MPVLFSEEFQKEFDKLKDKATMLKLIKHIRKLEQLPFSGKPLKHPLCGYRSVRMPPFRILYRIENDVIIIVCFDHRKDVYRRLL